MSRRRAVLLLLLVLVALPVRDANPWPPMPAATRWAEAVLRFTADPQRGGRELRNLARLHGMPDAPVTLVSLGSAYQHVDRRALARAAFERAVDAAPGDVWASRAELALGWLALRARDEVAAGAHFAAAVDGADGDAAALGRLMVERVAAVFGGGASLAKLSQLGVDPSAKAELRLAAQLEAAYAQYWRGDLVGALDAFDAIAAAAPDSPIADDAEYGAARTRWARGDRVRARDDLDALAARPPRSRLVRVARSRVDLDARVLTDRLVRRAQRMPPASPESRVLALYDEDGIALARSAREILLRSEASEGAMPAKRPRLDRHAVRQRLQDAVPPGVRVRAARAPSADDHEPTDGLVMALAGIALVVAASALGGRGTTRSAAAAQRAPSPRASR